MKINSFNTVWLLLLLIGNGYAQEVEKTRIYETQSNIAAYPCDVLGIPIYTDNRFKIPPYKGRFAVVRMVNNSKGTQMVVVRFLNWPLRKDSSNTRKSRRDTTSLLSKPSSNTASPVSISRSSSQLRKEFNEPIQIMRDDRSLNPEIVKSLSAVQGVAGSIPQFSFNPYFLISKSDLDSNCTKLFNSGWATKVFTLGVVTMPMKVRLGPNFDFQGNLSLGTTAGAKVRISQYNSNYMNLLVGLSLATVSLDSFSTSGRISGQPLTNIAVFSPSVGLVFDFGRAQVGAFIGADLLNKSTQSKYNWIYDKKPWLSIGFGFSIFSVDSKGDKSSEIKQVEAPKT